MMTATVLRLFPNGKADVLVTPENCAAEEGCAACAACGSSRKTLTVKAANPLGAAVGDKVEIRSGVFRVAIARILPEPAA
ncbi:MAG: SoxR reducing system RseC family protein [Oscillospiraceae bacterium]|jgi:hypothetical protein|nr:SoxR reducing system RseC family protein [Oscillospiraceae bacterium]